MVEILKLWSPINNTRSCMQNDCVPLHNLTLFQIYAVSLTVAINIKFLLAMLVLNKIRKVTRIEAQSHKVNEHDLLQQIKNIPLTLSRPDSAKSKTDKFYKITNWV